MSWWKGARPLVLTAIAGLVLVFGSIGFAELYPHDRPLDSLYRAVQLFGFGGNVDRPPNLWLEIARFLGPLVVGYAAISVVLGLYRDQIRWLRIRRLHDHVLIAGLGDAGFMMASAFDCERWRVIAIEQDPANPRIQSARERGIWVVQGDGTDPHILRKAGARRAALLVAMCGKDATNVDVASAARTVCRERRDGILTTVVDLHDFELWQIMKAQALVDRDHAAFRLELFNVSGLAAEMLIEQHPAFAADQPGSPHVLIVGMDGVGMSLIVEVLRRWQARREFGQGRLRITIADRSPELLEAELRACYPEISTMPDVELHTWRVDVSSLGRVTQVPAGVSAIYVCLASETRGLTAALAMRQHPGLWDSAPIVLAVADESAGVGAAVKRGGRALENVSAFGVLSCALTPRGLLHTATETIARLGHEFYRRDQFQRGKTAEDDRALVAWERLTPDLRESNRLWADGIAGHLSDLRFVVAPAPLMSPREPVLQFAPDEVERLAPLEHERWEYAMKQLGYRYGPTRTKHTHPMIGVPFEQLPEANKEKDRAHVRAIPAILAEAGFRITRVEVKADVASQKVTVGTVTSTPE